MFRHTPEARPRAAAPARSGGQSLDRHTQATMSARFGHDFSAVRIHTDSHAQESAQAIGANAYALGSDIAFGPGQYTPGSPATERLLAHELTHVVQQAQHGPGDPGRPSRRGDEAEREADRLASQVLAGQTVQALAAPQAAAARDEDDASPFSMMPNPNACYPDLAPSPLMMQGTGIAGEDHQPTWWDKVQNSLPYQIATNDAVSGTVGMAQTHLEDLHGGAVRQAESEARLSRFQERRGWTVNESASMEGMAAQENLWQAGADLESAEHATAGMSFVPQAETAAENTVSRFSPALGVAKNVGRFLSPFGMYSDGKSMVKDWQNGNYADAAADGLGLAASTIGTVEATGAALTAAGAVGTGGALSGAAATLNPAGAIAGSAAGGYALGKAALGEANDHAKKTRLFGKGEDGQVRDSTDAAADMGLMMKNFYGGGTLGNIAGAGTAIGASWGTAAYSLADESTGGGLRAFSSLFGDDDMVPLGPVIMQQMQQMQALRSGQAK